MNEPNDTPQEEEKIEPTSSHSIAESIKFVVDMMNEGKVNPKDVYPPNRYHGD